MDDAGSSLDEPHTGAGNGESEPRPAVANQEGLLALGQTIDEAHSRRSRRDRRRDRSATRRHRGLKRAFLAVGVALVLLVAGVAGYAWYLNHLVHHILVKGLSAGASHGAESGTENILLVGSTDRCALKKQYIGYGICDQGVNGINSDVVMILHLNPNTHSVSILSIPRDLFVPNARKEGANKIDAALYEGPTQLVAAIQDDFGIPIQHYVELNFDSFASVVNTLGGIYMYFPEPVYDAESGLDVRTPGCIHLDGFHALQVVRARHLQYKSPHVTASNPAYWPMEGQSDLARIRRDHEFLRVLATAMSKKGLGNPLTDRALITGVVGDLVVDNGFSSGHMINLVLTYHSVNVGKSPQLTVPVLVDQFGSYQYKGGSYGDIEFPSQPVDQSVLDTFLGITPSINSMTGAPLPGAASVSVSVENGTGVANQASDTAAALQALGFHIVGTGDTTPVGQEAETVVYYGSKSPAVMAAAQAVARSLSGWVILGFNPSMVTHGAQVTVDTGTNFSVNSPTPPPSSATSSSVATPATTTTTSGSSSSSSSSGAFSPATSSNQGLQPWDPRSCTANGGEGP